MRNGHSTVELVILVTVLFLTILIAVHTHSITGG